MEQQSPRAFLEILCSHLPELARALEVHCFEENQCRCSRRAIGTSDRITINVAKFTGGVESLQSLLITADGSSDNMSNCCNTNVSVSTRLAAFNSVGGVLVELARYQFEHVSNKGVFVRSAVDVEFEMQLPLYDIVTHDEQRMVRLALVRQTNTKCSETNNIFFCFIDWFFVSSRQRK